MYATINDTGDKMKTYYKGKLVTSLEDEKIWLGRLSLPLKKLFFSKTNVSLEKITEEEEKIISDFILEVLEYLPEASTERLFRNSRKDIDDILEKIIEKKVKCKITLKSIIFEKIKDKYGNYYGKELITGLLFPISNLEKNITREYCFFVSDNTYKYPDIYTYIRKRFYFKGMNRCNAVITDSQVANINEITEYQNRKGLKKKKLVKKISELFNKNIFLEEIEQVEEKEIHSYQKLNKNGASNIEDYFESLKKEYLENNLNKSNSTTPMTLDDIDKMEELFLKIKDEYSLTSQRKILKDIAFIYLMTVYENIDNITVDRLKESYFSNNLKSILLIIESLRDLGIIKNELSIDLTSDISLENILNIIQNIKFNDIERENVHKLIKSI